MFYLHIPRESVNSWGRWPSPRQLLVARDVVRSLLMLMVSPPPWEELMLQQLCLSHRFALQIGLSTIARTVPSLPRIVVGVLGNSVPPNPESNV